MSSLREAFVVDWHTK